ncbi:hypothetical protein [Hymenobacter coccineus]|uniref:Uncharacterized protein n=1 Tax=Hymenobacter coccineus TaxID=1908235 RepID=A0A1G1TK00_9BACT|nr:hypothetical protein [Hymenobacter coccineus]OGX91193.1 hypothetical protein BEN49_20635 [Hymenobacter coccineus]
MIAALALRVLKYVLLGALALVLGVVAADRYGAQHQRRTAPAVPVVVRKSAWGPGRTKTVRAVPPGPQQL